MATAHISEWKIWRLAWGGGKEKGDRGEGRYSEETGCAVMRTDPVFRRESTTSDLCTCRRPAEGLILDGTSSRMRG